MIAQKARAAVGRWLGPRKKTLIRDYSAMPAMLAKDFRCIVAQIRLKQKHFDDPEVVLGSLRTSAHIVDKGLQAENWKPGRSQIFYGQMSEKIEQLKNTGVSCDPSYLWAEEKRQEYDEAQHSGPRPAPYENLAETNASKEDLLRLILGRRSIRSFIERPIDEDVLRELAKVVSWSPTSCNRQSAKLFFTQNPEKVAKSLQQCAGATCLGHTPCFVSVCADMRQYMVVDRDLPLIDVSLGLQNMLLLAHAQSIEGTVMNWMHHTPKQDATLRKVLEIPDYCRIITNVILGYPTKGAPTPERKDEELSCTIVK